MIIFNRDICNNIDLASRKEWLETNGLGGYACGTVAGVNTRSYHSLLTVSLEGPLRRVIMLPQIEEVVTCDNQKYPLSTHQYRDVTAPQGYMALEEFRLDAFPTFTFQINHCRIQKRIFMTYGQPIVWILYQLLTPVPEEKPLTLSIRPLVNFRDHHIRQQPRRFFSTHHDLEKKVVRLLPDQKLPALNLYHNAQSFEHSAHWYHHLFYREEKGRGLDCDEDLFAPGAMHFQLSEKEPVAFIAATIDNLEQPDPMAAFHAEQQRRQERLARRPLADDFSRNLVMAADQFLVKRDEYLSVIAGYPWLPDSGREAMMTLPGLLLATGRFPEAEQVFRGFAHYCSEGMLPNYFMEGDSKPYYNTVDAALWMIVAACRYRQAGGEDRFLREELWPTMCSIIDHYQKGIRYNVQVGEDGLIDIPEEGAQLTWMDAQVGDWVVTPRSGKPVEVNALWYNAVCFMRDLAKDFGEQSLGQTYAALADKIKVSYQSIFWNEKGGYLFDRVENYYQDPALRPNQLYAVALPYPLFTGEPAKKILHAVYQELYTPFGFRSLTNRHEEYKGAYDGDIISREAATYQGSVWPGLLGAYADALRQVYGKTPEIWEQIHNLILPFESHLLEAGLGTISEMFDGDSPHYARGCISRAWSVAEILRVHLEWQGRNG